MSVRLGGVSFSLPKSDVSVSNTAASVAAATGDASGLRVQMAGQRTLASPVEALVTGVARRAGLRSRVYSMASATSSAADGAKACESSAAGAPGRVAHKRRRPDLKHAEEGKRSLSEEDKLDLRRAKNRMSAARSREGRRLYTASLELIVHRQAAEIASLKQELLDHRSAPCELAMKTALRETLKLLLWRDIMDADLSPAGLPVTMCEVAEEAEILNSASAGALNSIEEDLSVLFAEGLGAGQPSASAGALNSIEEDLSVLFSAGLGAGQPSA